MSISSNSVSRKGEHAFPPVPVHVIATVFKDDEVDETQIDQTLTIYLNDKLVELNAVQKLQIMEIITVNMHTRICKDTDEVNEDRIQFEYVLDANDTFLHSMFGGESATKIKQIVDHKLMSILLVIAAIVSTAITVIFGASSIIYNVYHITMVCLIIMPWSIFKHLLFNKVAFNLCITTFDLWIKVCCGLTYSVAVLFHDGLSENGFTLSIIREFAFMVFSIFVISYISSFDATHSTKINKLMISVLAALWFSYVAINTQFFMKDEDDYKIRIKLTNGVSVLSMQSLMASSSRILAIFMWKQSYVTFKSKERAVGISMSPKITWIDRGGTTAQRNLNTALQIDLQSCKQ